MSAIDRFMLSIGVMLVAGTLVSGIMYIIPRTDDNYVQERYILCFKYGYYRGKTISGNIDSAWKVDSVKFISLLREAEK